MEEAKVEKTFLQKNKDRAEEIINQLLEKNEISMNDVDLWYKVVDIHKDFVEEEKNIKEMIYMNYRGSYGDSYGRRGVAGTGRGRYRAGGNYRDYGEEYGARGYDTKYRGEEMLDEMNYHYGNYHDSYNTGNYGAKEDSAKKMTDAFVEFGYAISEELDPKEKQMFKQAMQEIMQELSK